MSDTDPNDNPNDVDRALAAFGATPIKYRSFGTHRLRPSAAYVPSPAIVNDTVYDPFGPQPVVHALDEARIGVVLPAGVPSQAEADFSPATAEFSHPEPYMSEAPASQGYVAAQPVGQGRHYVEPQPAFDSYEAALEAPTLVELRPQEHDRFPPEVPTFHEVPAPFHEVPAYGVPESHSDALPEAGHPLSSHNPFADPPPPPVPATPSWASQAPPINEPARGSNSEVLQPVPPGHRSRMHTAAALPIPGVVPFPMPHEAVSRPPEAPVPPAPPTPSYSAPIAPVMAVTQLAETPEPATLPTLGSQFAARQNHRPAGGLGLDLDEEPRSLAEMFRVLNGRAASSRRMPAPPLADGTSLFRRL